MAVRRNGYSEIPSTKASFSKALQPWTFPASSLPFLLGTILAWKFDQHFRLAIFALTAATILLTHATGNFVNSYYELKERTYFARPSARRARLLDTARFAIWSCFFAILSFLALLLVSEAPWKRQVLIFITGFLGSLLYGTGLKDTAAGEVLAGGIFGPVTVLFTYVVQAGAGYHSISTLSLAVYSIPLVFNTEAILHSQNTRDLKSDRQGGATTLAVILGPNYACAFYSYFLLIPHVVIVTMAVAYKSFYFLIPMLTLPLVFTLQIVCSEGEHLDLPQKTAGLSFLFGVLYVLSLYLAF